MGKFQIRQQLKKLKQYNKIQEMNVIIATERTINPLLEWYKAKLTHIYYKDIYGYEYGNM